jgi:hypothetical protein
VPLETFDESLALLRTALDSARLDSMEKIDDLRRLDHFNREVEKHVHATAVVGHENAISGELDGRSV